jgi:hypothetical protein
MDHREMPDERKQCCAHYECQVHPALHAQHAALQIAAQSHLAERFVARPLGARDERWVGSDWMIPSAKPITNLFVLHAGPDPGVDAANRLAARFDPYMGLAVGAGPIAEI